MKRRDSSFVIALCASLSIFLIMAWAGYRQLRRDLGWSLKIPGQLTTSQADVGAITTPPTVDIGDAVGAGLGVNSSQGDQDIQTLVTDPNQEQALMSRDRPGVNGKAKTNSIAQALEGDNGDNAPRQGIPRPDDKTVSSEANLFESQQAPEPDAPKPKPKPIKVAENPVIPVDETNPLAMGDVSTDAPGPAQPAPQPKAAPTPDPKPDPKQNATAANQPSGGQGGTPGASSPAGTPGPKGDFESTPVSTVQSAEFTGTRLLARKGRKMLTRRLPDISIAGWDDLRFADDPFIRLLIKIDDTGNVTDVRIAHPTGSDSVDLPCERAIYTWWFEPIKIPRTGKPLPVDVIDFTIVFR